MRIDEGKSRLASLLSDANVRIGRTSPPPARSLRSAWKAFRTFAAISVNRDDISADPLSDGLLFEFGVFDFGGVWKETFELSFVRQFTTKDGDLQQVHLVAHFPAQAFDRIRARMSVKSCTDGAQCAARCFFVGGNSFVGTPCILSSPPPAVPAERVLSSSSVWSFDTGADDTDAQRMRWIAFVDQSPVFRDVLARGLQPLGYEVWQESAE